MTLQGEGGRWMVFSGGVGGNKADIVGVPQGCFAPPPANIYHLLPQLSLGRLIYKGPTNC